MTITRREGPFVVDITGDLLTVCCKHQPVFTCRLRDYPWFVVHSDGLYAQNAHDALTPLYRGDDATQLLACLTGALQSHQRRKTGRGWLATGIAVVVMALTAWMTLVPPAEPVPAVADGIRVHVLRSPDLKQSEPNGQVAYPADSPAEPVAPVTTPPVMRGNTPADGWSLTSDARAGLPEKLGKAASRGIFTVPLSSGHARTLYVFADPACSNCRRMERHIETASGLVNVVIFPVTIEGRDASLKALTPVMALPEAERAAAWKQLFAADAGVPGAGKHAPAAPDNAQAEIARGAIGVNEVAFRAYRLPGTPWTISDDGRYVPQAVLSSPAALKAFLSGGSDDGQ